MVDIPDDLYHHPQCPGWSSTSIKHFLNHPPAVALYKKNNPIDSDTFALGRALHCLYLQGPETFCSQFCILPEGMRRDARSKSYQSFLEENDGKQVLKQEDYDTVCQMVDSLKANPYLQKALSAACVEKSIFWKTTTGLTLKCKPDVFTADGMLFDLKTTLSANPFTWGANAIKFGYDLSASLYLWGLRSIGLTVDTMHFAVIEKQPPYAIALRHLDHAALELGSQKLDYALSIIARGEREGFTESYPAESQAIMVPAWAFNWKQDSPTYE